MPWPELDATTASAGVAQVPVSLELNISTAPPGAAQRARVIAQLEAQAVTVYSHATEALQSGRDLLLVNFTPVRAS